MADAYQCDRCNGFSPGQFAAVRFDIEYMARRTGGDVILDDGTVASWSRGDTDVDLCPNCAVELIQHVDDYLAEGGDGS